MNPLNQQEQINELNTEIRCKLGQSKIHGVGVFAIRDIKSGEKCYIMPKGEAKWYQVSWTNLNKLFPEVRDIIKQRWASIINGSMFLSPNDDTMLILYMNHSDNPNFDTHTDLALKDIKAGEEITEDYCRMNNAKGVFPDLCKL